jgi:iron complex transport system substrate-binding protein
VTRLTRRGILAGLAAFAAMPARAASLRVATLDWAILETLLALQADVVAATELVLFRQIAVEPPVPDTVADLGLRGSPNFEVLRLAAPQLIFNSNFYARANNRLERIAPVESYPVYVAGERPYALAEAMARGMAGRLGLDPVPLIEGTRDGLAALRGRVAGGRPVLPINFGDSRHFRVFGADSMFGEVLTRLGLANAWTQPTSYSAMAPIGIETLAQFPEVRIAVIGPEPPDVVDMLDRNPFWHALPQVKAGRVMMLGPINPFGALSSAARFGRLLARKIGTA